MCCMDVCLDKNIMEAVWDLQRQKLRVCPRTASGSPSRSSGHERPASYPKISVSGKANQSVWFWSDITSSQRNQQAANKYINSSLWKLCFVLNVVRDGVGMFEQWLHERTLPPSGLGLWLKGMGFAWTFFFFYLDIVVLVQPVGHWTCPEWLCFLKKKRNVKSTISQAKISDPCRSARGHQLH